MKAPSSHLVELSAAQLRQYIDAEAAFSALEETRKAAAEVRGSMFWRNQGDRTYLIRASASGAQTSLGPKSDQNIAIYERLVDRKRVTEDRLKKLGEAVTRRDG